MNNMKRILAVTVFVSLMIVFSSTTYAQEADGVGVVSAYEGEVEITRGNDSVNVSQGTEVVLGDVFDTGEASGVKIVFVDDTLISLGEYTTLEINEFVYNPDERSSVSNITRGKMRSLINKFKGATSSVEYKTSNAVAGVKGTELYIEASDEEIFAVNQGEIVLKGQLPGAKEIRLGAGQFTRIVDGVILTPQPMNDELWNKFRTYTDFNEIIDEFGQLYEDYYPGEKVSTSSKPSDIQGLDIPTIPPVDLTPGGDTNIEGGIPVEIIIPGVTN